VIGPIGARDTIFALSSGALPAAIAVVRVSGARSEDALERLGGRVPAPRRAAVMALYDDAGELLDRALVLWLPGPDSVTGEDVVELHLHGGRAVVAAVLAALGAMEGLRPADPGEFTRRAFQNGRLGLDQVEGLADLLSAETEWQRRQAIRRADGGIGRLAEGWRDRLLAVSAHVEAALQFGEDEDDVPALDQHSREVLAALQHDVGEALRQPPAERLRDGVRVLIAGPVNAGKSSLFNALAGRDAAIVSDHAGTTRDLIEAPLALDGVPLVLIDTAGLRETSDPVERIGVERVAQALEAADLVLWLGEPEAAPPDALVVHARADVPGRQDKPSTAHLLVSTVTGQGLAELRGMLLDRAAALLPDQERLVLNARQRGLAQELAQSLCEASATDDAVLLATHLATARAALDAIAGGAGVEHMLDALFGRFCIGK
jgi:tRNA modification GTPase